MVGFFGAATLAFLGFFARRPWLSLAYGRGPRCGNGNAMPITFDGIHDAKTAPDAAQINATLASPMRAIAPCIEQFKNIVKMVA